MASPDPLRQRAETQLEEFLNGLPVDTLDGKTVHRLRVLSKKWRAYLALYPADVCPDVQLAKSRLKRLANQYGSTRDSAVLLKTFEKQIKFLDRVERERLISWFRTALQAKENRATTPTVKAVTRGLRACLKDWPADSPDANGIDTLRAKAGQMGKKALKQDDDARYHRWRKWVKHHYYSLATLSLNRTGKRYRRRLKKLGVLLGRYHDLTMLEAHLLLQPGDPALAPLVELTLVRIDRDKIRRKKRFSRYYAKLYSADSPANLHH